LITRCPYADCAYEFELNEHDQVVDRASNGFVRGCCARCARPGTLKPLDLIAKIERKARTIIDTNRASSKGTIFDARQASEPGATNDTDSASGGIDTTIAPNGSSGTGAIIAVSERKVYALLDDLRSLHNVGSIFRTADAFSFERIFLSGITGTPEQSAVQKTSLSAEAHVAWQYSASALAVVRQLQGQGVHIVSLEKTSRSVELGRLSTDAPFNRPVCLVVGNEVSGVSEEVLAASDYVYHIPMLGTKESLNVAVAFGIAAYALLQALTGSKAGITHGP